MAQQLRVLRDSTDEIFSHIPTRDLRGDGRIDSVNVRVQTVAVSLPPEGSEDVATFDATDTALENSADSGAMELTVADVGTFIDDARQYAVFPGGARRKPVIVECVDITGSRIGLAAELPRSVPASSPIVGLRVSHALTAAETAQRGEAMAVWTAVIDGISTRWTEQFRVVRQILNHGYTVSQLLLDEPSLKRIRQPEGSSLTDAINAAWDNLLLLDLEGMHLDTDFIRSAQALWPALSAAVRYHLVRQSDQFEATDRTDAREHYHDRRTMVLNTKRFWYDDQDELAGRSGDEPTLRFISTRYTR